VQSQRFSQHPVDQLIRTLIGGRAATPDDVAQIIARMATAPFDSETVRVRVADRGISYRGLTRGARAASLDYHLIKRVMVDQQWVTRTTTRQYLADLRRAVRDPSARLAVYERQGGSIAATIKPTAAIMATGRQGAGALPGCDSVW
jgi:hypothetical protein